jgi:hypothetical protein
MRKYCVIDFRARYGGIRKAADKVAVTRGPMVVGNLRLMGRLKATMRGET